MNMKQKLIDLWQVGVNAAKGEQAVYDAMKRENITGADAIIAVGKAAASMALGALKALGKTDVETLIITKYGHGLAELDGYDHVTLFEAAHPIPDENSLSAGFALLSKVKSLGEDSRLVFLVSGGASALVEHLADGLSLFDLQTLNVKMMQQGLAIGEMNKQRRKLSQIKYGKLLSHFGGAKLDIFYISDVEGDELSVIGSGIAFYDADLHVLSAQKPQAANHIVASNALARAAIEQAAIAAGFEVICNEECLYDDIFELAPKLAERLIEGAAGVYIFGGEPTVNLPPLPGNGGRNQSLGLALAEHIYGRDDIELIVAGTDGTDGPTDAAGAIVDGSTFGDAVAAKIALEKANAGDYLDQHDGLYKCGPTGTNVMDIIVAIKTTK
ncbi:MAG: DUF4147 domain-containing protein [OCS116 cluster bacterium]|nr:DUF4147 domain-containing protein [OCS116 cluster bacterium]